jgi:hypothetical protein
VVKTLTQMNERIMEGKDGTIAAVNALGLNIEQLRGQSPDKTFLDIAEAVAKIEDPSERAKLSTGALKDLFGQTGPVVLRLVDELGTLMKRSDELGNTLNDSATGDWAKLSQAITDLIAAGKGLITVVLTPIIPLFNGLAFVLNKLVPLLRDFMAFITAPFRLDTWVQWLGILQQAYNWLLGIIGLGQRVAPPSA